MALTDVIKTAMEQLQFIAKTETVIGEPIVSGGVTLIPVSRISIGFAAGGGNDNKPSGAGTGGGVSITPIAFISIIDGRVHVHSLTKSDFDFGKLLALAPDLVQKVSKFVDRSDKKDAP
jgi:uncharacterized spore protein YtfJ